MCDAVSLDGSQTLGEWHTEVSWRGPRARNERFLFIFLGGVPPGPLQSSKPGSNAAAASVDSFPRQSQLYILFSVSFTSFLSSNARSMVASSCPPFSCRLHLQFASARCGNIQDLYCLSQMQYCNTTFATTDILLSSTLEECITFCCQLKYATIWLIVGSCGLVLVAMMGLAIYCIRRKRRYSFDGSASTSVPSNNSMLPHQASIYSQHHQRQDLDGGSTPRASRLQLLPPQHLDGASAAGTQVAVAVDDGDSCCHNTRVSTPAHSSASASTNPKSSSVQPSHHSDLPMRAKDNSEHPAIQLKDIYVETGPKCSEGVSSEPPITTSRNNHPSSALVGESWAPGVSASLRTNATEFSTERPRAMDSQGRSVAHESAVPTARNGLSPSNHPTTSCTPLTTQVLSSRRLSFPEVENINADHAPRSSVPNASRDVEMTVFSSLIRRTISSISDYLDDCTSDGERRTNERC